MKLQILVAQEDFALHLLLMKCLKAAFLDAPIETALLPGNKLQYQVEGPILIIGRFIAAFEGTMEITRELRPPVEYTILNTPSKPKISKRLI